MRHHTAVVLGAALLAVCAVAPTSAQNSVSGEVESVAELSVQRAGGNRVLLTVTATEPGTALTITEAGRPRSVRGYRDGVTGDRAVVSTPPRGSVTFTFGPQTP